VVEKSSRTTALATNMIIINSGLPGLNKPFKLEKVQNAARIFFFTTS